MDSRGVVFTNAGKLDGRWLDWKGLAAMKRRRRRAPIQQRFWMAKARALAARGYTSHQIRLKLPMLNIGSLLKLRREMNVKRWSHDVTVARVGFMRSLYKSGISEMKIAEIYGMTVYKVRKELDRLNIH